MEKYNSSSTSSVDNRVVQAHTEAASAVREFYEAAIHARGMRAKYASSTIDNARDALLQANGASPSIKEDIVKWVRMQHARVFADAQEHLENVATPGFTTRSNQNPQVASSAGPRRKTIEANGTKNKSRGKHSPVERQSPAPSRSLGAPINNDGAHNRQRNSQARPESKLARARGGWQENPSTVVKSPTSDQVTLARAKVLAPAKPVGNNPYMSVPQVKKRSLVRVSLSTPQALILQDFEKIKRELDNLRAQVKYAPTKYHADRILKPREALLKNDIAGFRAKHVANSGSAENRKQYTELQKLLERCRWSEPRKGNSGSVILAGQWGSGRRA